MATEKKKIQEQYFYKRQVKVWKQDFNAISKLGYKGYAIQGLTMDLIIEYQGTLHIDTLCKQVALLGLTKKDVVEALDLYEDFNVSKEGLVSSIELDLVLAKDEYFTRTRSNGGIESAVKNKRAAGHDWTRIADFYKIDVNALTGLSDENRIKYIINNKQT